MGNTVVLHAIPFACHARSTFLSDEAVSLRQCLLLASGEKTRPMLVRAAHAPQKYFQRKQLEASALGMILHIDTLTRVTPSIESLLRPFAEGAYPGEISQQRRSLSLKISRITPDISGRLFQLERSWMHASG